MAFLGSVWFKSLDKWNRQPVSIWCKHSLVLRRVGVEMYDSNGVPRLDCICSVTAIGTGYSAHRTNGYNANGFQFLIMNFKLDAPVATLRLIKIRKFNTTVSYHMFGSRCTEIHHLRVQRSWRGTHSEHPKALSWHTWYELPNEDDTCTRFSAWINGQIITAMT
jgi:hypothetical protein